MSNNAKKGGRSIHKKIGKHNSQTSILQTIWYRLKLYVHTYTHTYIYIYIYIDR